MDDGAIPNVRRLTEADSGSAMVLRTGDRLSVSLGGNPTTGYSWQVAAVDERVLAPAGEPGYRASSPAIGAGGVFTFEFEAVAAGRTTLRLAYRRPWEKRRRPMQTFAVTVTVEPPGGENRELP
jgi:inhibitor of cysteine peptidase